MEKQFKPILLKKDLQIRKFLYACWNFGIQNKRQLQSKLFCIGNSKYYSYGIVNSLELSQLNLGEGNFLSLPLM